MGKGQLGLWYQGLTLVQTGNSGSIGFPWLLGQGGALRSFRCRRASSDSSGVESLMPQGRGRGWGRVGQKVSGMGVESLQHSGSPVQELVRPGERLSSWQALSVVVV